jgi:hypothetical protein
VTDPVSGVLLSVFLKKIADPLREPLAKALQGRRSRGRKRQLLDLYTRLKTMESSIGGSWRWWTNCRWVRE